MKVERSLPRGDPLACLALEATFQGQEKTVQRVNTWGI